MDVCVNCGLFCMSANIRFMEPVNLLSWIREVCQDFSFQWRAIVSRAALDIRLITTASGYL